MRKLMIASSALACCAAMTTDPALAATNGHIDGDGDTGLNACSISDGSGHYMAGGSTKASTTATDEPYTDDARDGDTAYIDPYSTIGAIADSASTSAISQR